VRLYTIQNVLEALSHRESFCVFDRSQTNCLATRGQSSQSKQKARINSAPFNPHRAMVNQPWLFLLIDLVTLAAMLRHAKINMVLRYAHPTASHQTQAMNRMETWVTDQRFLNPGAPGLYVLRVIE
jgi:hypothetical protein